MDIKDTLKGITSIATHLSVLCEKVILMSIPPVAKYKDAATNQAILKLNAGIKALQMGKYATAQLKRNGIQSHWDDINDKCSSVSASNVSFLELTCFFDGVKINYDMFE